MSLCQQCHLFHLSVKLRYTTGCINLKFRWYIARNWEWTINWRLCSENVWSLFWCILRLLQGYQFSFMSLSVIDKLMRIRNTLEHPRTAKTRDGVCLQCGTNWIIFIWIFYLPTGAHENCFKNNFKIYIKTAPTYFGLITIIRERIIRAC
jgi:hypothetical protein